jgi:hypothetical protein
MPSFEVTFIYPSAMQGHSRRSIPHRFHATSPRTARLLASSLITDHGRHRTVQEAVLSETGTPTQEFGRWKHGVWLESRPAP